MVLRRSTAAISGLAALLLAGCQPQAPDGTPAKAPADASATQAVQAAIERGPPAPPAFQGDLDVVGTEPFWNVAIRDKTLTITRPDKPPVTAANHGPRMAGNQAVWASLSGEEPIILAMVEQDCSDGMSDTVYAYAAELQLEGEIHSGCAKRAEAR